MGLQSTGLETSYRLFLNPIASPILVLFFGGFIMAIAAAKHGLDLRMAKAFVKTFRHPAQYGSLGNYPDDSFVFDVYFRIQPQQQ